MVSRDPQRQQLCGAEKEPQPPNAAWATRRAKFGPAGHAGYRSRRARLKTPLETAAMRLIVKLHQEQVLSEGQCCKALALDRVDFRDFVNRFAAGNSVGECIYNARQNAGLTQQQLSDSIGITRPQIANIETGRCDVATGRLLAIAGALGVSAASLLPVAPVEASPRQSPQPIRDEISPLSKTEG